MKLEDCTYGKMVITKNKEVGFIKGLTFNIHISLTGDMSNHEKYNRTIPIVEFPSGKKAVHPSHLSPFIG
jgi:hypothetical protein